MTWLIVKLIKPKVNTRPINWLGSYNTLIELFMLKLTTFLVLEKRAFRV